MRPVVAGGGGVRSIRTAVRALVSPGALCLVLGLAGGLLLGYVLSREDGWLTPAPWAIYLVALLAAIAAISWFGERRRVRAAPVSVEVGATPPAANPTADEAEPPANVVDFRRERSIDGAAADEAVVGAPEATGDAIVPDAEKPHEEVAEEC